MANTTGSVNIQYGSPGSPALAGLLAQLVRDAPLPPETPPRPAED